MKNHIKHLTAGALVLAALEQVHAQYAPPPPPAPFQGFINEYLRGKNPYANQWDIGGDVRLRYEVKEGFGIAGKTGSVDFRDHGADVNNDYFLERLRLHVGYTEKWWNVYIEGQSSLVQSDERKAFVAAAPPLPHTATYVGDGPESDQIDLHQAYFTVGNHKEFPVSLKVGRQELSYGDERLIGAFGWNNIGRAFDAAKVRWQNAWFAADFFTGMPVVPRDGQFDMPNSYDWISGAYLTWTQVPKTILETYFLARNASREAANFFRSPQFPQPTARDIYTIGGRLKSKPGEFGHWDYLMEGAYQFGNYAATFTGRRLEQSAYMFVGQIGYTFADAWATPRVALEYSFSSGDENSTDGTHGTFDNLFPTNHKFYGYMDFLSLQNLQDLRAIYQIKPTTRMSVSLEGHAFWLADTSDALYTVAGGPRTTGGYGINKKYDNYVGSEIDLIAGYALTRYASLEAGYGHFFAGKYIDQSEKANGGATDADWVYLQTTIKF